MIDEIISINGKEFDIKCDQDLTLWQRIELDKTIRSLNNLPKILVATCCDLNLPFSIYSSAINALYAMRHGYDYHILTVPDKSKAPLWGKNEIVYSMIGLYDYIFVIDADAYIQKHEIPLTNFIEDKNVTFTICEHFPEWANTGAYFVQNNDRVKNLLDKWYQKGKDMNKYWEVEFEQSAFIELYKHDQEFRKEVKVYPFNTFNGSDPNSFVMHMMRSDNDKRMIQMKDFWEKIKNQNVTFKKKLK